MNFDLVVVGGGPVGAACVLAARGLRAALVSHERREPAAARDAAALDARVYALSPGNVEFLRALGVWQALAPQRLAPVHAMRIFGDRPGAELAFDAYRAGVAELAWTVEDAELQDAMWRCLQGRDGIEAFAPAQCESLQLVPDGAQLQLRDGRRLAGALVVGADGANSFVRREAGIGARAGEYAHSAVVANFDCEKAHGGTAFQWFQGGPVLALLPLPGKRLSMVWSAPAEKADVRARLRPAELCAAVEAASGRILGALSLATPARSYPLQRLSASRMSAPRIALAGDAAHVIHPLAGQGLNLGLNDVRALARVLSEKEPGRDPGDARLLRRYERLRAEPVRSMERLVDGLFRLFDARGAMASFARNTGLNLTSRLPVLKNLLIREAMR
ncbi:MAG TPA: FAD-dependent monooxygenase [Burkholderiales bacterium]|nr:FAD-dependent monooxygenase [Burkholderiales bacterium]